MQSRSQRKRHWWRSGFISSGMSVILIVCVVFLLILAGGTFNAHTQNRGGQGQGVGVPPIPNTWGSGPVPQYPPWTSPQPPPYPGPDVIRRPEVYDQYPRPDYSRRPEVYDQLPNPQERQRQIEEEIIREAERQVVEESLMAKLGKALNPNNQGGCCSSCNVDNCAKCCPGTFCVPLGGGQFFCSP